MSRDIVITRRNLLTAGACGLTLSSLPINLLADQKKQKPWMMRLSASSICYKSLSIEDACREISQLGFEGIDIWASHANCKHLDDVQKRLGAEGLKKLLKKHKLKLTSFSIYGSKFSKYAKLLGTSGGGVAIRGSSRPCKPAELSAKMKAFLESLKPAVELAEKNKSYLAIENHGNALLNTVDSFKAFVDLNNSKHLGIAVAPYHLQAVKASVPDVIKICGKQLFYFYAWQKSKGMKQLPGHGPTDFTPWIKALHEIKYTRFVNPFMHGEPKPEIMTPAYKKSREYLLECEIKAKSINPKIV